MNPTNIQLISLIEGLVEICKDGEQGYKDASDDIKDKELTGVLLDYSLQREKFMYELKDIIEELGGSTELTGSFLGILHRRWMDLRFGAAGSSITPVLKECLRGEKNAITRYTALINYELPPKIGNIVNRQLSEIQEAFNNISRMLEISEKPVADVR